jgi:uncharacterized protein (DUF433 family)
MEKPPRCGRVEPQQGLCKKRITGIRIRVYALIKAEKAGKITML